MSNYLNRAAALALAKEKNTRGLMVRAAVLRDEGHGSLFTYSRKVFIPLTQLCRDVVTTAHLPIHRARGNGPS